MSSIENMRKDAEDLERALLIIEGRIERMMKRAKSAQIETEEYIADKLIERLHFYSPDRALSKYWRPASEPPGLLSVSWQKRKDPIGYTVGLWHPLRRKVAVMLEEGIIGNPSAPAAGNYTPHWLKPSGKGYYHFLWHKENRWMVLRTRRIPSVWQYIGFVERAMADITFSDIREHFLTYFYGGE